MNIIMPSLGEGVIEATVSRWLKRPGEAVAALEPLVEVLTDKVDTEIPAPVAGTVIELLACEGEIVPVGAVIARLAIAGEPQPDAPADLAEGEGADLIISHRFVSPVARRLAAAHGIDVEQLVGTGERGRVTKRDVEAVIEHQTMEAPVLAEPVNPLPLESLANAPTAEYPSADSESIPISPLRRTIAEHMLRSKHVAPHATTVMEADLSRVVAHRTAHADQHQQAGVRLTFTPYFVYAAAVALRRVPIINASFSEHGIRLHRQINIGLAVAIPDGLLVPVIHAADERSLRGLARAVNDLATRARARQLQPDDTRGGTFTVTNHGGSGSLLATPIIHQPQAAILGIGAIQKRVIVLSDAAGDTLAIRPMCYLSLSFDHRLIDGATADAFLAVVKDTLERFVVNDD